MVTGQRRVWLASQSTHRVAMVDLWRTFHHVGKIGKISSGWCGGGGSCTPNPFTLFTTESTYWIYKEHHSACPLVRIGTPPTPLSQASVPSPPPPGPKGGEGTVACGWGGGGGSIPTTAWRESLALCRLCDLLLRTKLQFTLQLKGPVHSLYFVSTQYVLCGWHG